MIHLRYLTVFGILFLYDFCPLSGQEELHVSAIEKIEFSCKQFSLTGNLYLPETGGKSALAIWVHGDGPDLRTGRFPGTAFFNTFLDHGYAYFRYDKPGSGDSRGSFTDSLLFYERAGIVNSAFDKLKNHPRIDSSRIGLVGSSQAGYVIPIVLTMRTDVAFVTGLSLPAMDGNEQWAYLLKMQMICEGYSKEQAEEFSSMHLKLIRSASYEEFLETVRYFEINPVRLTSIKGYDENFADRIRNWWPLDWVKTQSFNPMTIIAHTRIPFLSIYGEYDTQVDPRQGAQAYQAALEKAENPFYEVRILERTDHNMAQSKTGCLIEQQERGKLKIADGLSDLLATWLTKLNLHLETKN